MASLQVSKKREMNCDDRLRKAIDDLRAKYPKSAELGLLKDHVFVSVQYDIEEDGSSRWDEQKIRHEVCRVAQNNMRQIGQSSLRFSL